MTGNLPANRATMQQRPLTALVSQHVDECAALRVTRTHLVRAPAVRLHQLGRHDDRMAAHLDGVRVAGDCGRACREAALEMPDVGRVFVSTAGALEDKSVPALNKLIALSQALPATRPGLYSAFGWITPRHLQGTTRDLLLSGDVFRRQVGLAACAMHRVDPLELLRAALTDDDAELRQRAARCAGELGRVDLLGELSLPMTDADTPTRMWRSWSAVLLGERGEALSAMTEMSLSDSPQAARALRLFLLAVTLEPARAFLRMLSQAADNSPTHRRRLIRACGYAGDSHYVPWLISLMSDDALTRLAGESFSIITGADLPLLDLERKPSERFESAPNDDPNDDNVAMDEDDGLPWPDQAKAQAWWQREGHRFQFGVRYFVGAPPSWEHCIEVLKTGYQRQRVAAAETLCLLRQGTILFNTAAPAWRQQRQLASLA